MAPSGRAACCNGPRRSSALIAGPRRYRPTWIAWSAQSAIAQYAAANSGGPPCQPLPAHRRRSSYEYRPYSDHVIQPRPAEAQRAGRGLLSTFRGPPEPCWDGHVSCNGSALPSHPSHPRRPTDGDFPIARSLRPPAAPGLFKTVNQVARHRADQPGRLCSANPIY